MEVTLVTVHPLLPIACEKNPIRVCNFGEDTLGGNRHYRHGRHRDKEEFIATVRNGSPA